MCRNTPKCAEIFSRLSIWLFSVATKNSAHFCVFRHIHSTCIGIHSVFPRCHLCYYFPKRLKCEQKCRHSQKNSICFGEKHASVFEFHFWILPLSLPPLSHSSLSLPLFLTHYLTTNPFLGPSLSCHHPLVLSALLGTNFPMFSEP